MKNYLGHSKIWFLLLLLVAFVAGCGSDDFGPQKLTSYSLNGVSGSINEPAKTVVVTVPYGTDLTALVATFTTTGAGLVVGTVPQKSGTTANDFTAAVVYTLTESNGLPISYYTVNVAVAANTAKALTAYAFAGLTGAAGVINETAKTIAVTVPFGTDVTNLVATFATTGTSVKVGAIVQTSTATANNFTAPVDYAVTAANGTTAIYTVTVTVAQNSAKAITAYSFAGFSGFAGTINESAKTIAVTVPNGTAVTALVAIFSTTGNSVKVGANIQTSNVTANNFSAPVAYLVTAADGTTALYTVTVSVAPSSAKVMTTFAFAGYTGATGTINQTAKTIAVTVPNGTVVTALVATFSSTGTSVKVGTTIQTSTATANDFTAPVAYIVTAADGTTAIYTVTVTVAPIGAQGPAAVNLGTAGNFVILAKSTVTMTGVTTAVVGDIGLSPAAGSYFAGFSESMDSTNLFSTSTYVAGKLYAATYAPSTPAILTTAIGDMETAYTDAAGRITPDFIDEGAAGDITGKTLIPGLYKWNSNVSIQNGGGVTLAGGANDVWIMQVSGDLAVGNGAILTLGPGVQSKNIFWQVSGQATLGTTADFKGIILSKTQIVFNTGAVMNGRALAQTAVTLDATAITEPAL